MAGKVDGNHYQHAPPHHSAKPARLYQPKGSPYQTKLGIPKRDKNEPGLISQNQNPEPSTIPLFEKPGRLLQP